jgi:GNAT superfamily N-acetyltransferase
MQSSNSPYDMCTFGPEDTCLIQQFIAGFRHAFDQSPQVFFNLDDRQLAAPGSVFAAVRFEGQIVAGARGVIDGTPSVYVGQCYTVPPHRGRGLIGAAVTSIRDRIARTNGVTHANLVVRMIGGVASPAVISAYRRVGFVTGGMRRQLIDPTDPVSRHLLATADPGGVLSVLTMSASPESLQDYRAILCGFERQAA